MATTATFAAVIIIVIMMFGAFLIVLMSAMVIVVPMITLTVPVFAVTQALRHTITINFTPSSIT
jgi:hypothetical protein